MNSKITCGVNNEFTVERIQQSYTSCSTWQHSKSLHTTLVEK